MELFRGENNNKLSVTYWMNKLQNLDTKKYICNLKSSVKLKDNNKKNNLITPYGLKTFKTQKKIKQIQEKTTSGIAVHTLGMVFMRMELNLV